MTYRQIFEAAREAGHDWADAALENCYQFNMADDECKPATLSNAIVTAFVWRRTEQKEKYWEKVYQNLPESP